MTLKEFLQSISSTKEKEILDFVTVMVGENEVCDTCRKAVKGEVIEDTVCTCYMLQESNRIRQEIRNKIQ